MLVAPARVGSRFLDGLLSDANLAILDRPTSFYSGVEQMIDPSAEAFGLLVSEIAGVEEGVLKLPFEVRSARFSPVRHQVSKHGPQPCVQMPAEVNPRTLYRGDRIDVAPPGEKSPR
jgi:hypothetical protein